MVQSDSGMDSETGSSDLFTIGVILLLIFFAYGVAAVLPGIAVTVRRLRDAGYHWASLRLRISSGLPWTFRALDPLNEPS